MQKLPPNMKEAWSLHTVKKDWTRPTLLDFNDWLKDKAEAHERMRLTSGKTQGRRNYFHCYTHQDRSKVFATASSSAPSTGTASKTTRVQLACIACKDNDPLWRCRVFLSKTPTERAKVVAENKLCSSCLKGNHSFRQCPQPRKCNRDDCSSSHKTLLHGAERVLQPRTFRKRLVTK